MASSLEKGIAGESIPTRAEARHESGTAVVISTSDSLTPTAVIETHTTLPRPGGIYREYLPQEKLNEIPYLKQMQASRIRIREP